MDGFSPLDDDSNALLMKLVETLRSLTLADPDIMTLPQVAVLLRCSEDTLRRVSEDELSIYRVGKTNLYLRDDILKFVRTKRVTRDGWRGEIFDERNPESSVDQAIQRMVDSSKVDARKPSKRRVS